MFDSWPVRAPRGAQPGRTSSESRSFDKKCSIRVDGAVRVGQCPHRRNAVVCSGNSSKKYVSPSLGTNVCLEGLNPCMCPRNANSFTVQVLSPLRHQGFCAHVVANDIRALCGVFVLCWRNLGLEVRNRNAGPTVRTRSGLAERKALHSRSEMQARALTLLARRFAVRKRNASPAVHSVSQMQARVLILGWRNVGSAFPDRVTRLLQPGFHIPSTRSEPYGAHSFWVGET